MDESVTVRRLQHVSIPRPRGSDEETRRFYGGALGLDEISVPDSLAHLDLVWFRLGGDELHVFASDETDVHGGQHFCIEVSDVAALRRRLSAHGVETRDDIPIRNRPRFNCRDPFGNLIEITTIQGSYLADGSEGA